MERPFHADVFPRATGLSFFPQNTQMRSVVSMTFGRTSSSVETLSRADAGSATVSSSGIEVPGVGREVDSGSPVDVVRCDVA